ncbi:MAG: deoxyhypusine synthase family protein [Phycisphaeraceae bacterium]
MPANQRSEIRHQRSSPATATATTTATTPGPVRQFLEDHFLHFNSRELVAAAAAYERHIRAGGPMLVSLAGAMSTAKLGKTLARLIRAGYVHAISCTGANIEEDVYNLLAYPDYKLCPDWRALSAEDELELYQQGYNRVTDTCIPEDVMHHLEGRLIENWKRVSAAGRRKFHSEFILDLLKAGELEPHYRNDPAEAWTLAAAEADIPVYTPGWEDSTTGNMFAAAVERGDLPDHLCVRSGTEQMQHLLRWYQHQTANRADKSDPSAATTPAPGFFQIGGGIAGDFAICAVPTLVQDLKRDDTPRWGYFCQISDAVTSYGGYSGAVPNEKITWGKLDVDTPSFMIQSDATIVAPLIFAYLLND